MIIEIEDTMEVGEHLLGFPAIPVDDWCYDGPTQFKARVVTPDGNEFEATIAIDIPRQTPPPEVIKFLFCFKSLKKTNVPIGSKVYFPGNKYNKKNEPDTA